MPPLRTRALTVIQEASRGLGLLISDGVIVFGRALRLPMFWILSGCLYLTYFAVSRLPPDNVKAFGELVKSASTLAWPILIYLAARLFRPEMITLFRRVKKVGPTGAEFAENVVASQVNVRPITEVLKEVDPSIDASPLVGKLSEEIRKSLNAHTASNPDGREALLLFHLADARLVATAFRIHNFIFGSQVEALERMAASNEPANLEPFYKQHVERYRAATSDNPEAAPVPDFSIWARYLVDNRLAIVTGFVGRITDEGRALLNYFSQEKLPRIQGL